MTLAIILLAVCSLIITILFNNRMCDIEERITKIEEKLK
mgnify:CR=1 FL=1